MGFMNTQYRHAILFAYMHRFRLYSELTSNLEVISKLAIAFSEYSLALSLMQTFLESSQWLCRQLAKKRRNFR